MTTKKSRLVRDMKTLQQSMKTIDEIVSRYPTHSISKQQKLNYIHSLHKEREKKKQKQKRKSSMKSRRTTRHRHHKSSRKRKSSRRRKSRK